VADPVVRAERLGKRYSIGARLVRRPTLREALAGLPGRSWRAILRRAPGRLAAETDLWAVRDLTFALQRGEILGILGANGCGKTTVLRMASGITEPTEGWIATRGRVATLLEVGAGFHPDLTGRENVLLSGIVLGMRAAAVRRRFDEIVEFAGVSRLIDTPVKHYSSGMYVRLAFSVAAHLEADILLVDEVVAVGDLEFQEKCLARMGAARDEGRSVILVTHSVSALRRLCTRALLLENGRLAFEGSADGAARRYEGRSTPGRRSPQSVVKLPGGTPDAAGRGIELRIFDDLGAPVASIPAGPPWRLRLEFELDRAMPDVLAALTLGRVDGTTVLSLLSARSALDRGRYQADFRCEVPLTPTDIVIGVELWSGDRPIYRAEDAAVVEITEAEPPRALPVRRGFVLGTGVAEIRSLDGP